MLLLFYFFGIRTAVAEQVKCHMHLWPSENFFCELMMITYYLLKNLPLFFKMPFSMKMCFVACTPLTFAFPHTTSPLLTLSSFMIHEFTSTASFADLVAAPTKHPILPNSHSHFTRSQIPLLFFCSLFSSLC